MPADPQPISREEWIEVNLKASETTSGIVEAAPKVGLDVYPVLSGRANSLGYVEKASFNRALDTLVKKVMARLRDRKVSLSVSEIS